MIRIAIGLLLLGVAHAPLFGQRTGTLSGSGSYPNVRSAEDVIQQWDVEQHLYVKGDLGIGRQQLEQLETWLDRNAPHWTVVLMQNADGEVYRSLDQRTYRGMDAVEFALSRGLALRTGFANLRHPKTNETDGAVFALFLAERKFSYYASDAQDQRSLGEAHWVGELDRPAFRAMRGGGRIINAVQDTISNINARLEKRITAEAEQVRRQQEARQRAFLNLQTDLESLAQTIDVAEQKAAALRNDFPDATGSLTQTPTEAWRRQLQEIQGFLTVDNVAETTEKYHAISHQVEAVLNAFAERESFPESAQSLEAKIQTLQADVTRAGVTAAEKAASQLGQATERFEKGEPEIAPLLVDANAAIEEGNAAIATELERRRRERARKQLIRRTIMGTAGLLGVGLLGVLVWLNRRRAPAKQRAEETLRQREQQVNAEMEKVYELFDRSGEILGDKEKVKRRGYQGATRKLTNHTFEDIDDLFVMSTEVRRVMDEAVELVRPKSLPGKVANLLSASRFEQGVNRITGEPLTFHRDKGLPLVIERESERTGAEPPEEVTLTFEKVFAAFHERTATAEDTLNTIENSLLEVDDRLKLLQTQIESVTEVDRDLADAADDDGLMQLPALFDALLPSAQQDFDTADDMAGTDPVKAIQTHIAAGDRKMQEALAITACVQYARSTVFPLLNELAPPLQQLGYQTEWMQQQVSELGERANQLCEQATTASVGQEAQQLDQDVRRFEARADRTLALARELQATDQPTLERLAEQITKGRNDISQRLGIESSSALVEYEANPDDHLAAAREQLAAAQAALQHGQVEAASTAQQSMSQEIASGQAFVSNSLQILHEFDRMQAARQRKHEDICEQLPGFQELVDDAERKYDRTALVLQAGDPTFENAAATVLTHFDQTHDTLQDAEQLLQQAGQVYGAGRLLEAREMLDVAEQECEEARQLLAQINEHCTRLASVAQQNEGQLASLLNEVRGYEDQVQDARTMEPTISLYETTIREIELAQSQLNDTIRRDPFHDAQTIAAFSTATADLEARLAADQQAHAEAARAVAGAKAKRELAEQLIQQARHDGIPDSPATTTGIREVQMYDGELHQVERELHAAHRDWKQVDQKAAAIHGDLGVKVGRLRGELERAQQLVGVFQNASNTVFEATRWTGGFGTRIFGSPGSKELDRARQALNAGDYAAMAELARAAQIAAQHAIERAQREVYRRQREAARRAEAARRERRRNSSISIGSGSRMGGGISRSGSSGSSGSSSSSSSSPSGSGFSRSGW